MRIAKDDPIVIIGAGLSGVMTAFALQQKGFTDVKIYEKEASVLGSIQPIFLGANVLASLRDFEMADPLVKLGKSWERYIISWRDGKILKTIDLQKILNIQEYVPLGIVGKVLYDTFFSKLQEDTISFNASFLSYTQLNKGVEIHLEGRESVKASVLIGADGLDSRVRLQMLGETQAEESEFTRITAVFEDTVFLGEGEPLKKQPMVEILGPHQSFRLANVGDGRAGIQLVMPKIEGPVEDPRALFSHIESAFGDWADQVKDTLKAVPIGNWRITPLTARKPQKQWYEGHVVLIGDAIQPLFGYAGYDTDLAIESALLLAHLFTQHKRNLDKALRRYQQRRVKRARIAYSLSNRQGKMLNWGNPLAYTLRNWLMPNYPTGVGSKNFYAMQKGNYKN